MPGLYEHPETGEWVEVPTPIPLKTVIRNAILNALAYTDGHQANAAKCLAISPRQMNYQVQLLQIHTGGNAKSGVKGIDSQAWRRRT
jgi:transcriptional regulator with GAF, ATPase, and Fis domain